MTKLRLAYGYSGLPGSGKSTAAEIGREFTGGTVVASGDIVRRMAEDEGLENPTSEELAQFASRKRQELGHSFFADKLTQWLHTGRMDPKYPLHLDGIRHVASANEFRGFFDLFAFIRIEASREIRYRRITDRGREGEGEWTMEDLERRDEIEMQSLGQATLLDSDQVNFTVTNESTLDEFRSQIADVIDVVDDQRHALNQSND